RSAAASAILDEAAASATPSGSAVSRRAIARQLAFAGSSLLYWPKSQREIGTSCPAPHTSSGGSTGGTTASDRPSKVNSSGMSSRLLLPTVVPDSRAVATAWAGPPTCTAGTALGPRSRGDSTTDSGVG